MNWTRIIRPEPENWFSPQLAAQAQALGAEVDQLEAERRQLEKSIAEAHTQDVTEADLGNLVLFPAHRELRLTILQKEIKLRRKLAVYYDALYPVLNKEVERAHQAAEQAERDLRKKLVKLGYHDVPNETLDPAKIQPVFILAHPAVRAARERHNCLRSRSTDYTWIRDNQAALDQTIHELETARQQALPT